MFKLLKHILTNENPTLFTPNYSIMAVDNKIITNWYFDGTKLSSYRTEKSYLYNTNENPNQPTKSKLTRFSEPSSTILEECRNPFGLPDENCYMLYYIIRYGVALIDEDHEPVRWSDYNYYMNQDVNNKPFLLVLVPKDMKDVDEDYNIALKSLDFSVVDVDYHDGTETRHINLSYIQADSEINPFLDLPLNSTKLTGSPDERFEIMLRRAFKSISIARLLKKYSVSENYHPLLFPEHKEYVDKLLALDSLYKETLTNASKLTTYFRRENNKMSFETYDNYARKIKSFGTKLNEFIRDYNDLTAPINEFNSNLGKKKVEMTHKDFLSQFD